MKYIAKPRWCEYGERRFYARSKAEAAHAEHLEMLRKAGAIADWRHEPRRYPFPNRTIAPLFYLPDFEVTQHDGTTKLVEVKGRWEARDRERVRLMAKHYPDLVITLVTVGRQSRKARAALSEFLIRLEATRAKAFSDREKAERKAARESKKAAKVV